MTNCKNCQYTDEYCASGDCERNADVSKTLTKPWKESEYVRLIKGPEQKLKYVKKIENIDKELTYYVSLTEYNEVKRMLLKANNEINKLKELLKECKDTMNMAGYVFAKVCDVEKAIELIKKIDEVLK